MDNAPAVILCGPTDPEIIFSTWTCAVEPGIEGEYVSLRGPCHLMAGPVIEPGCNAYFLPRREDAQYFLDYLKSTAFSDYLKSINIPGPEQLKLATHHQCRIALCLELVYWKNWSMDPEEEVPSRYNSREQYETYTRRIMMDLYKRYLSALEKIPMGPEYLNSSRESTMDASRGSQEGSGHRVGDSERLATPLSTDFVVPAPCAPTAPEKDRSRQLRIICTDNLYLTFKICNISWSENLLLQKCRCLNPQERHRVRLQYIDPLLFKHLFTLLIKLIMSE